MLTYFGSRALTHLSEHVIAKRNVRVLRIKVVRERPLCLEPKRRKHLVSVSQSAPVDRAVRCETATLGTPNTLSFPFGIAPQMITPSNQTFGVGK